MHLCLAVKQTNGSIQNVQVIKMTPLIIGCMHSLVICNHLFLYIFIGAIELFVICKHWLYVSIGYIHSLVICIHWLYGFIGYMYSFDMWYTWLYALIGYMH